ncbi:luciferase, partial [Vibrio vulnificus]|nr:luciferase [Vibrio vulnificus]
DNPLTALAKSAEREMIVDEMRKLAASQIIRQMARLKASIPNGSFEETDSNVQTQSELDNSNTINML